ncbi:MAG: HAD-IIB family hydrolase [Spirochaetes bacterium]|nr:HAD-IIB family hydrolase [Spirochaetota bacterium]
MSGKKLHIQMFSLHGLLRGENLELGRDADTGGQIQYVVELARYLGMDERIGRVDLFTRLVTDKTVSADYSNSVEVVNDCFRIVRIQCGGRKYMRKELLWDHLDEYIDKTIKFIKREDAVPDIVHGHYADAGYVALRLSEFLGVPFIFTGHSLGRSKFSKLLEEGMRESEILKKYRIDHRIEVEEEVLQNADLVIASTEQEVEKQYGPYSGGRLPPFAVIPPGVDLEKFYPYHHVLLPGHQQDEREILAHVSVLGELNRFFMNADKPLVLALCRPDKRKNITGLIMAFGEDLELQAMANLAVFAGIRKDIAEMEENERSVLTEMLLMLDKYDLYGKMAIPKKHEFEYEVPELYKIAAAKGGVFVNAALIEPFGLTLIEASASGLPIVATNDGGPRDIIKNCENGLLVDAMNTREIAGAIKKIISDTGLWKTFSGNGIINVREHYSWTAHVAAYLDRVESLCSAASSTDFSAGDGDTVTGRRFAGIDFFLITDIDNTLIGGDNSRLDELMNVLRENRGRLGFGVATGRTIDSALALLERHGVRAPDVIISSVGSEIYYGRELIYDRGWHAHISEKWEREKIVNLLSRFEFLEMQGVAAQRKLKISYFMEDLDERLPRIHDLLTKNRCAYNLIYSQGKHLDILPARASKGKAIRYISYKWEVPLENMLVAGDSGNDEEMLRGDLLGVVVGNYSPELEKLRGLRNIYFAREKCAGGILEGIGRYRFIEKTKGEMV